MPCVWFFFFFATQVAGDLLRGVSVPEFAFSGSAVSIGCEYDLRQAQLYSLKWYHNMTEFYRYVPTERPDPINIRPTLKFVLHEVSRTERQLILNLSKLSPLASGEYRCEVIAEHPSFRTEALSASMRVLRETFSHPVITHAKEIYEPSDVIKIGCQPESPIKETPRPVLVWYLDGEKVGPKYLSSYGYHRGNGFFSTNLHLPAKEVLAAGGTMKADCALVLGNLQLKTSQILRVRRRLISYVNSCRSTVSCCSRWSVLTPVCLLVFCKVIL